MLRPRSISPRSERCARVAQYLMYDRDDMCGRLLWNVVSPYRNDSNSPRKDACLHRSVLILFGILSSLDQSWQWFWSSMGFHESRSSHIEPVMVLPKAKAASKCHQVLIANHNGPCFHKDSSFKPPHNATGVSKLTSKPLSGTFRVCWCAHYFMGCTQGSHFASSPQPS